MFVDEFGAATDMQRTHGRAAKGERVVAAAPHGHYKSVSTIAAMTAAGVVAAGLFTGATDTDTFVAFVADSLVPVLVPGQVLILDDLSAHKSPRVDALVEAAGCRVLRLPPYSPDLNPIGPAISKVKTALRALARRSVDGLFTGINAALKTVTATDALHYMAHCGYTATGWRKPL